MDDFNRVTGSEVAAAPDFRPLECRPSEITNPPNPLLVSAGPGVDAAIDQERFLGDSLNVSPD